MGAALSGCSCRPSEEQPSRSLRPFLQALKEAGGVEKCPDAQGNKRFLDLLDNSFPELELYRRGRIQTSPGVEEVGNSPTEYYRMVGAIVALLACYSSAHDEEFGLECVSAGQRGPMSLDQAPGKFINMGNKKTEYYHFCENFAKHVATEADWWGMMIFLVIHDVGKSDEFRKVVNDTLPPHQRTHDHDKALSNALKNEELKKQLLPSVMNLSRAQQESISAGFATNFQLPQLGQGEIACINFRGLLELERQHLVNGTLHFYFYHSIFDIAGASCSEKFVFPLALVPVYVGFTSAMDSLITKLLEDPHIDERTLYFNFLYTNFQKSYPDYEKDFSTLCKSIVFCHETGLATLRVLAMTRNTYKNPAKVTELLLGDIQQLVQELAGSPVGPQIMLYYGPDLLRMGLGEDLSDLSGQNMMHALEEFRGNLDTLEARLSGALSQQLQSQLLEIVQQQLQQVVQPQLQQQLQQQLKDVHVLEVQRLCEEQVKQLEQRLWSGQETLRKEALKREQHLAELQDAAQRLAQTAMQRAQASTEAHAQVFSASSSLNQRLQLVEKELQSLQRHEKERHKRRILRLEEDLAGAEETASAAALPSSAVVSPGSAKRELPEASADLLRIDELRVQLYTELSDARHVTTQLSGRVARCEAEILDLWQVMNAAAMKDGPPRRSPATPDWPSPWQVASRTDEPLQRVPGNALPALPSPPSPAPAPPMGIDAAGPCPSSHSRLLQGMPEGPQLSSSRDGDKATRPGPDSSVPAQESPPRSSGRFGVLPPPKVTPAVEPATL